MMGENQDDKCVVEGMDSPRHDTTCPKDNLVEWNLIEWLCYPMTLMGPSFLNSFDQFLVIK